MTTTLLPTTSTTSNTPEITTTSTSETPTTTSPNPCAEQCGESLNCNEDCKKCMEEKSNNLTSLNELNIKDIEFLKYNIKRLENIKIDGKPYNLIKEQYLKYSGITTQKDLDALNKTYIEHINILRNNYENQGCENINQRLNDQELDNKCELLFQNIMFHENSIIKNINQVNYLVLLFEFDELCVETTNKLNEYREEVKEFYDKIKKNNETLENYKNKITECKNNTTSCSLNSKSCFPSTEDYHDAVVNTASALYGNLTSAAAFYCASGASNCPQPPYTCRTNQFGTYCI